MGFDSLKCLELDLLAMQEWLRIFKSLVKEVLGGIKSIPEKMQSHRLLTRAHKLSTATPSEESLGITHHWLGIRSRLTSGAAFRRLRGRSSCNLYNTI